MTALAILPIQTNDFADPYYDLVLKLVGVVAIKTIGRDIIDRALDIREEVKPHKVYNYVAIGSVAGIVVHFYAFTGACYLSQTLSSHWMKAFWPLAVTFTLTLHFLFLLIVDCKSTTLNATMLASASLPSALMNMGFPYQSTLIIASAIAIAIWELKIFAARQAPTQIYPTVRNDRTSELEIHT